MTLKARLKLLPPDRAAALANDDNVFPFALRYGPPLGREAGKWRRCYRVGCGARTCRGLFGHLWEFADSTLAWVQPFGFVERDGVWQLSSHAERDQRHKNRPLARPRRGREPELKEQERQGVKMFFRPFIMLLSRQNPAKRLRCPNCDFVNEL